MDRYALESVLLLSNTHTQYGVLHSFRNSLRKGLSQLAIQAGNFAFQENNFDQFLIELYRSPVDCTIGFNGPKRNGAGKILAEEIGIPHVSWLLDPAHFDREFIDYPYNLLIVPDQKSADCLKDWGAAEVYFLPHAADPLPALTPIAERKYPVVFLGSIADPEEFKRGWKEKLNPNEIAFLLEAAEKVLAEPNLCYQDLLQDQPSFSDETIQELDLYIRMEERIRLLRGLKGLSIHFFGDVIGENPRKLSAILGNSADHIQIHPAVDFPEGLEIMQQAQVVLNSSPMFKTGGHERIFYALSSQSVLLTNETPWICSHFNPGKDLLTFRSTNLQDSAEELKELLQNPEQMNSIAALGNEKFLSAHTWNHRARELVQILNAALPNME